MTTKSKFIVVEHNAKKARLHWDLRFIMPNSKIWMSFAVRKGVPLEPGQKVLAVRTHDHTEKEALMLGTIESGYGAGELKKWDDGACIIHKYSPSHILIEFKGKKVKGFYHLINTGVVKGQKYKSQQYMLFKGKTLNA
jgi:bifunctional non-homologous end joining protein LigD